MFKEFCLVLGEEWGFCGGFSGVGGLGVGLVFEFVLFLCGFCDLGDGSFSIGSVGSLD